MSLVARGVFTVLAIAGAAMAQSNTATLDGLVKDTQGALVPNAVVTVVNTQTQQTFRAVTDDKGHWAVPALATATYSVSVEASGFKKSTAPDIHMDAGIPATVNVTLEVGTISETVEVQGGAEVLQTQSATVTTDLTGRQVSDLPIPSRNATDLLVTMPGTQTPAGPRNTTFFGLPQATMNMTLDGVNIQDNLLKNSSGGCVLSRGLPTHRRDRGGLGGIAAVRDRWCSGGAARVAIRQIFALAKRPL